MNKKIFYGVAVFIVAAMAAWNVNFSSKTKEMSDVSLAIVEALAGCESSVESKKGREVTMHCPMSGGGTYDVKGCDFDNAYTGSCTGRCANCT